MDDNELLGTRVVFTGKMESMTREQAAEYAKELGMIVESSITLKTDYLVTGEKTGRKLDKAKELGVTILSESDWLELIEEYDL